MTPLLAYRRLPILLLKGKALMTIRRSEERPPQVKAKVHNFVLLCLILSNIRWVVRLIYPNT
nr:MAG TPA: hypothetical protein [Caudoviricetes sp.]